MTRHGKNSTASSVYSYHERRKDAKESGYGTLHERLGADSVKEFDCCSLTLQPCREPVITPNGFLFDKEAVLEYILAQKRENARRLKEWHKQLERDEKEVVDKADAEHAAKVRKFTALEGTPAHPGVRPALDAYDLPGSSKSTSDDANKRKRPHGDDDGERLSNMVGKKSKQLPSFWIPELNPTASATKLEKPSQKVVCPMSGKLLKVKDLMPVNFTAITDGDDKTKSISKKTRYMCPITHDALTNTSRCAYLKTSGSVVTMSCVDQIIRKDMIDPINGKKLEDDDIIELQRGGTGFAATNQVKAKLSRPVLELQ
uniref:Nitric oxide synthase-interacting protein homolog n=1 Tax=Plectus sambesii TaxID=2011161 RepID=A0A914VY21_9BILA